MEIGRIVAIPPVPAVRPAISAPDLPGIFAVEFRKQSRDDTADRRERAARGLEDEEENSAADEDPDGSPAAQGEPSGHISLFA